MPASQAPAFGVLTRDARRLGFTLIEVTIAMLIATIMCGIAIYLFSQVQRGSRISLARAQLSLAASAVDARLRLDAASMLPPSRDGATAGGCLVIVPALREGYVLLPSGQLSANKVRLRSDQLVFISRRNPSQPHPWLSLLPLDQNAPTSANTPSPTSSWEARIWYGAVRDAALAGGDGSKNDSGAWAHLWSVGRQAKLLVQDQKGGAMNCAVVTNPDDSTDTDTTSGGILPGAGWTGLKSTAIAGNWTDDDYVTNLALKPGSKANYANQPLTKAIIDLKALQRGDTNSGVQFTDLSNSHLRLFENCSEIVIQWAGDLDKDGKIDTYPAGHPLAGAIIWYPEELHDKGSTYDGAGKAESRLTGWNAAPALETGIAAKYRDIKANPWTGTFAAGFAPALGAWPKGRFGAGTWPDRFQFDYREVDGAGSPKSQTTAPTMNVPEPYVFRFEDDQYRLVRYGFRQDGSMYANQWDGQPLPAMAGGGTRHWFPYPPLAAAPTTYIPGAAPASADPPAASLYAGKAAPLGPYPLATAVPKAADYTNFGDMMGAQMLPGDSMQPVGTSNTGPNGEKYRTAGDGIAGSPNQYGSWVTVASPSGLLNPAANDPWLTGPPPTPSLRLTAPSGAADIAHVQAAPPWPYVVAGELRAIRQMDGARLAGVAKPVGDAIANTALPLPSVANPAGEMAVAYGAGNNATKTYSDLYAEYLKTINDPTVGSAGKCADAGRNPNSREDWRVPQSDWPKLIRIRVRLHDSQGLVSSYSDEFLVNGRDDDGDGVVDNPEEGRMSGIWYEYILAVPYPMDANPRTH